MSAAAPEASAARESPWLAAGDRATASAADQFRVRGQDVRAQAQIAAARIGDDAGRAQRRGPGSARASTTTTNAPRSSRAAAPPRRRAPPSNPTSRCCSAQRIRAHAADAERQREHLPCARLVERQHRRRRFEECVAAFAVFAADRAADRQTDRAWRTSRCRACAGEPSRWRGCRYRKHAPGPPRRYL